MVFTVEPGIYLPGWGGVRIEDDILVTDQGFENFSAMIPRTTEDIEALMDPEIRNPENPGPFQRLRARLNPKNWLSRSH